MEVLAHRGHEAALHALGLQPQHHHDVGVLEAAHHVVEHLDPVALDRRGQERLGRDQADPGAHGGQQQQVRAGDARMQDVAADRDREPLDPPLAPADGERIEQCLGRVLVAAVAGIDHRAVDVPGEQRHRAAVGMARDQHVRVHGVQGHRGVDQGLALLDRRRADRHVDHVGAEPLAGQLEGGARPRRALEEQVDLGETAQHGELLVGLAAVRDIGVGTVEQMLDFPGRQALDAEQMALAEGSR